MKIGTRPTHGVRHVEHDIPRRLAPGQVVPVRLELENTGTLTWQASSPRGEHVGLAVFLDGTVVVNHPLPRPAVAPGERVVLHFALDAPLTPGKHLLELKLVHYQVAVFADRGSAPLCLEIEVADEPPEPAARLWALLQAHDAWHYLPTRGIARARDGRPFPVFVERAQGCHLWDASGRRYIDYTMGWGSVLLGHAYPAVQAALRGMLDTGATVSWPQPVELELAEMLCRDFAPEGMVCFAKNGSDACSFAVRMARVFTGKRVVLFSGYHGWQDFWVEQIGFERTGVAPREPPQIHRFPFHDLDRFWELYERHRSDLAAVMVEPSPWAGDGLGFEPDTQADFLRTLERAAREAQALFVMDEIVTGYRYPEHSAQRAKGVTPDLTCLGKAIANGMPLSAVVGRADVFRSALPRTFYAATFHGESYSLAAAKAAIGVYHERPVARHVWDYGTRLRGGIERLCAELGIDAHLMGPPFRMNFRFRTQDPAKKQLQRTLCQQELLKHGIATYNGVVLPCWAHDDETLSETLAGFSRALEIVADTERRGDWDRRLEIPPLIDL